MTPPPTTQPGVKAEPPHADPKAEPAKPEKLYEVKFDNTEWSKVFEWLERESGLMYITKDKPTGSVTLKPDRKYTLGELIDLLNERLELDKFVILRKSMSFATFSADTVDASDQRAVTTEQFEAAGRGELRSIVHELLPLEQAARAHQKMDAGEVFGRIVLRP